MAKIIDPDDLNIGTELEFITSSGQQLIRLNIAGNLTGGNENGVSFQALYSKTKEVWRTDNNLIKFPFPFISITTEQFELINGWNFSGSLTDVSASQYLVRDGGWAVVNTAGSNTEEWMNLTTLGTFDAATDQAYYYQTSSGDIPDTIYAGAVNQGIRLYVSASDDLPTTEFDYRDFFKIYLREQGKTYGFYDLLAEQNLTTLTYRKFALPLTNATDLNISASDAGIDSDTIYQGMSITYFSESVARTIGAESRNFHVIIDGNNGTKQQIYEWTQRQLRKSSDIQAGDHFGGVVTGSVAEELLQFSGDTLQTKFQSAVAGDAAISGGVFIDNFQAADTNTISFTDDLNIARTFPFVAAGNLLFNTNLTDDSNAIYKVFFTNDDAGDNTGRDFGTENAIIIEDNSDLPITGSVGGTASIAFSYDYDGNVQRGAASAETDVPFTGVALGLGTAQYVVTTGTWTRSTTNTVNFVAGLERNYANPA